MSVCNCAINLYILKFKLEVDVGDSPQVHVWMTKMDTFPSFGGKLDVKGLNFHIADAPASFKVCFLSFHLFMCSCTDVMKFGSLDGFWYLKFIFCREWVALSFSKGGACFSTTLVVCMVQSRWMYLETLTSIQMMENIDWVARFLILFSIYIYIYILGSPVSNWC